MLSIIIPSFNEEKMVPIAAKEISAVMTGAGIPFQLIFVDDGSKDNTASILESYKRYSNFHYLSKHNEGVSIARNTAISLAKGDYIWGVDADDLVLPGALSWLLDVLRHERPEVVLCDQFYRFKTELEQSDFAFDYTKRYDLTYVYPCVTNQIIPKRQVLVDHGICFDNQLYLGEDILWARTILANTNDVMRITKPIYGYRDNLQSVSYTRRKELQDQRIVLAKKLRALPVSNNLSAINRRLLSYNLNRTINAEFCSAMNIDIKNVEKLSVYSPLLLKLWKTFGSVPFLTSLLQRITYLRYPVRPYSRMFVDGIF